MSMRLGREGKQLKVKVARDAAPLVAGAKESPSERTGGEADAMPAPGEQQRLLSDEEVAWRLHQELNATSPMLRTRSRKAPELLALGQPKTSGGTSADQAQPGKRKGAQKEASGSQEAAGGSKKAKGQSRSVNKGSQPQDSGRSGSGADSDERPDVEQPQQAHQEGQQEAGARAGAREPASPRAALASAKPAGAKPKKARRAQAEGGSKPERGGKAEAAEAVEADLALDVQPAASSPAQAPAAPAVGADARAAAGGSSPSSEARGGGGATSSDRHADSSDSAEERAAGAAGAPGAAEDGAASRPAGHTEAQLPQHGSPEDQPAELKQEEQAEEAEPAGQHQLVAGGRRGRGRGGRQPRIPKLPMVRQEDGRWYRARLLRDDGDQVSLEFTGFESQFPPILLPRTSDRIWRGSYKGKDWKHLGGGAWEPKTRGGGVMRRGGRGGKRKRGERRGSEDAAHSSGAVGEHSHDEEHSDDDGFDEAESGKVKEEPSEGTAGLGPKQEPGEGADGDAAGAPGDAAEPARKKARRNTSRKRLDPIVREALINADQGLSDSEEQAGPSAADGQSTPAGWKATWKRHQRMALAAQQAAAAAEMGDAEALGGLPHLTPTPETPITRLGKRSSLTPGALQPLSPRAAAAAAAAIEAAAAGGATSRHRQRAEREHEDGEAAGLPLSPRGHAARSHRGGSAAAWASAAAAVLAAAPRTSDAGEAPPQSPRQRGRAGRDRDDGPASPRHGTSKAAFAAGREEEGDSGDGQDARGRRRRQQQQQQRAAAEGSDSEEQGANATGSDSQEEQQVAKARPRRHARKASIYKDADFAFGEEAEEVAEPAAGPDAAGSGSQEQGGQAAQPARRRRKPLVSSPAPTDVDITLSGPRSALPAALAALDVLPPPPPSAAEAVAAAAWTGRGGGSGGQQRGREGAGDAEPGAETDPMAVDLDEAAAVAALADMPSPRAAPQLLFGGGSNGFAGGRPHHHSPHHPHHPRHLLAVEAEGGTDTLGLLEEDEGQAEDDDGDADYAPPVRRREGMAAGSGSELERALFKKRSVSASLSLGLDHVRGGRVHKGTPLSRHHSLTQRYHAERDHPSNGRLRLSSSHHHHQHQRSHPHAAHHRGFLRASSADAGGYGGRGSSGMERGRAGSLGLREGVDGIAVAQGMFGTILSALKKVSLVKGGGGNGRGSNGGLHAFGGSGGNGAAAPRGGLLEGLGGGGGAGGGVRPSLHLFSSAWSSSRWHSYGNGEAHPSILTIQPDLFSKACAANGAAAFGLGLHSQLSMHAAASKPPLPLFC